VDSARLLERWQRRHEPLPVACGIDVKARIPDSHVAAIGYGVEPPRRESLEGSSQIRRSSICHPLFFFFFFTAYYGDYPGTTTCHGQEHQHSPAMDESRHQRQRRGGRLERSSACMQEHLEGILRMYSTLFVQVPGTDMQFAPDRTFRQIL
jgi:hypothetical protein